MLHIKKVGVLSLGKMMGMLYALLGLIFGSIFTCISLIGSAAVMSEVGIEGAAGMVFGLGAIIIFPLMYGVIGFIGGIIVGLLYNLIAGMAGGIEIYTE
jgi:hypothetical protein